MLHQVFLHVLFLTFSRNKQFWQLLAQPLTAFQLTSLPVPLSIWLSYNILHWNNFLKMKVCIFLLFIYLFYQEHWIITEPTLIHRWQNTQHMSLSSYLFTYLFILEIGLAIWLLLNLNVWSSCLSFPVLGLQRCSTLDILVEYSCWKNPMYSALEATQRHFIGQDQFDLLPVLWDVCVWKAFLLPL